MEMVIVPPIGAHLVHPRLARGGLAQRLLDRGVDEDAFDLGLLGGRLDDARLTRRPMRGIDGEPVLAHHVDRRHFLAFAAAQRVVRHRRQPHVGVEADLMRSVAGQHRPAARLRNVADENARPNAFAGRLARKAFEEGDHRGMAPIAIARQAHHLPSLAVDRQRLGARQTAARIEADRARLHLGRRHRAAENLLGRQFRIGGIGERGQGRGLEGAFVLRQRAPAGAAERGGEARQSEKGPSHRSLPRLHRDPISKSRGRREFAVQHSTSREGTVNPLRAPRRAARRR